MGRACCHEVERAGSEPSRAAIALSDLSVRCLASGSAIRYRQLRLDDHLVGMPRNEGPYVDDVDPPLEPVRSSREPPARGNRDLRTSRAGHEDTRRPTEELDPIRRCAALPGPAEVSRSRCRRGIRRTLGGPPHASDDRLRRDDLRLGRPGRCPDHRREGEPDDRGSDEGATPSARLRLVRPRRSLPGRPWGMFELNGERRRPRWRSCGCSPPGRVFGRRPAGGRGPRAQGGGEWRARGGGVTRKGRVGHRLGHR